MKAEIIQYKWAGKKAMFKVKSKCEECDLTTGILNDMMKNEFKGKDVRLKIQPWLDSAFYVLARGAWHPPIIFVNGKKFFQYSKKEPLFNRKKLHKVVLEKLKDL